MSIVSLKNVATWMAAASLMNACGARHPDAADASRLQHDFDKPTRGSAAWMWHAASDAVYADVMAPLVGVNPADILPADDALVTRTQFWLDQIDKMVRRTHAADLANVPAPRATVVRSSTANAFVAPVPVCYDVQVQLSSSPFAADAVGAVILGMKDGKLEAFPDDEGAKCVNATSTTDLQNFITAFNAQSTGAGACQLTLSGTVLQASSGCERGSELANIARGRKVVLLQTANHVTVYTGIMPLMSESAFVAALAHELGHYYRSHSTAFTADYDYFYTLGDMNPARKPIPEPGKKALGNQAVAASVLLNASSAYTLVSGQKQASALYFTIGTLIKAVCEDRDCSTSCLNAQDLIDGSAFNQGMAHFPYDKSVPAQLAGYQKFEAAAQSCLQGVRLETESGQVNALAVSWDKVQAAAKNPTWPNWLGDTTLPAKTKIKIAMSELLLAKRLQMVTPRGASTLWDALAQATLALKSQDDTAVALLKQANAQHLGQYTIEQEADEESIEWIGKLGLDPTSGISAMDSLNKGSSDSMGGFVLGAQNCEALYSRHWTNSDGSTNFVPIGNYAEIHHSLCYRMFNMDREIKTFNIRPAQTAVPSASGESWDNLTARAKNLIGVEESKGGVSTLTRSRVLLDDAALQCVYAQ